MTIWSQYSKSTNSCKNKQYFVRLDTGTHCIRSSGPSDTRICTVELKQTSLSARYPFGMLLYLDVIIASQIVLQPIPQITTFNVIRICFSAYTYVASLCSNQFF